MIITTLHSGSFSVNCHDSAEGLITFQQSLGRSLVLWCDELLGGNEDTIQEFSLILLLDLADTVDLGAAKGDLGVVDSLEDELVLDVLGGRHLDGAALLHLDQVRSLSTEEVLDFDLLLVLGDECGNWEMCMYHLHSVSETLYFTKSTFSF